MAQPKVLKVNTREALSKRGNRRLRKEGILPGSISSKGAEAVSVSIKRDELLRALASEGMSAVFKLQAEDKTSYNVMVKELQSAPITGEVLHVTFQHVSLTEETRAEITIQVMGRDSLEHKRLEFQQQLNTLPVRGLPQDIPNAVEIEVGDMEAGDTLYVSDLKLPEGIETEMDLDRVVFSVSMPRVQEVEEPAAEEGAEEEAAEDAAEAEEAKEE